MSSGNYQNDVKKILIGLAEFYGVTLSTNQLAMYSEDLMDIEPEKLMAAVKLTRKSEVFFPKPAVIRQKVFGNTNDVALEIANKIVESMSRFGWNNSQMAKEFMGEIAWDIVVREGGWANLCERTKSSDLPTLKAQWRGLAAALSVRREQERTNIKIGVDHNLKFIGGKK